MVKKDKAQTVEKAEKKAVIAKSKTVPSKLRRHVFWYASVALVGGIVVGGVYYENRSVAAIIEKPVVARTQALSTQIAVVSDPGVVVSTISQKTVAPSSRLANVQTLLATMTTLEARLTETEAALQNMVQQSGVVGVSKENLAFSEMVAELRMSYQRGDVLLEQITQLQLFARDVMQDIAMADSLEILLSVTPTEGPVTLAELAMMATKMQMRGLPTVSDMLVKPVATNKEELSFLQSLKNWFVGLIQVRKISDKKAYDLTQPWVKDMEQLQIYLLRGRADTGQNFIAESEYLSNDKRLVGLSHTLDLYLRQQQALQVVLNAYTG